ncbi:MAG: hypothetical protein FWF82_04785, partial [Oscillospiraceae bacterium]|nr:hypothetical protein [Oscillospiraceae bacterium]
KMDSTPVQAEIPVAVAVPTAVQAEIPVAVAVPTAVQAEIPVAVAIPTAVQQSEPVQGEGVRFLKYKRVLLTAVPVVIIALVIAVFMTFSNGKTVYGTYKDTLFLRIGNQSTVIVYDNGKTVDVDGSYHSSQTSLDGTKAAFMTDYYKSDQTGVLYYTSGSGTPVKVADYVCGYVLADSGKGLIYWKEFNRTYGTAELYLFDGKESALIYDEAVYTSAVISPNGKTVLYLSEARDYTDIYDFTSTAYVSTGGGAGERLDVKNINPVAVADGAKYLYYIKYESEMSRTALRVRKGAKADEDVRLSPASDLGEISLNKDYSQIAFTTGGEIRISVKGGDSQKITNGYLWGFIAPQNAQKREFSSGSVFGSVYGFSDFGNKVFGKGEEVYLLDGAYSSEKISGDAHDVKMSYDGKMIYFTQSHKLMVASATNAAAGSEAVAENVENYVLTNKSGTFYYVGGGDNELRRKSIGESGEGTRVTSDSVEPNLLYSTPNGTVYFFTDYSKYQNDGTLNFTTNTQKKKIADDVRAVYTMNNNVFYMVEDSDSRGDFVFYRSPASGRFAKIAEGAKPASLPFGYYDEFRDYEDLFRNYYGYNDYYNY